jgi:hypothetical protein
MAWNRDRVQREFGTFMRQYGRTAQRGGSDPNDRGYDRKLENRIKQLPPEELDRLLNGDPDEEEDD